MASRQISEWPGSAWELKSYVWRGKGEKSVLTGKQVRPIVAADKEGKYHAGLRNWSYNGNGKATEALYHHAGCSNRAEAISRAQGMCKEWVAAHRELASDIRRSERVSAKQSAAQKYGAIGRREAVQSRELHR